MVSRWWCIYKTLSTLTDFEKRNDVTFDYIETILLIFNRIHKAVQDPSILNVTEEEFLDCQALSNHDIPDNIWESAKLSDNGYQMSPKLPLLSKIATYVFVVPHSNANEENFFSIIPKNKTEFQSRLNFRDDLIQLCKLRWVCLNHVINGNHLKIFYVHVNWQQAPLTTSIATKTNLQTE